MVLQTSNQEHVPMKWFKHDSSANADAKLKKVRAKYGMEGYGLYWYCLELVAMNVEKHNLTFELEHDSELISIDTGIHVEIVQEIMTFMVRLGLFEGLAGNITCLKMATRTDEYTQKLMRDVGFIPTLPGLDPESVGTKSELKEEKEEKREGSRSKKFAPPTIEDVRRYIREKGYQINPTDFVNFYQSKGWMVGRNKMKDWKAAVRTWEGKRKKDNPVGGDWQDETGMF